MKHVFNRPWALAAVAGLIGSAAVADVTATDPYGVMRAMQDFGFVATLETDSDGDPKISSRVSDSTFSVYFFGCEDGKECDSIEFRSGYDLKQALDAAKVNEWNRKKRFTKAYVDDEGDPFLEMDVNLDFEGVGVENFSDTLDLWRLLIEDFEEFIDW